MAKAIKERHRLTGVRPFLQRLFGVLVGNGGRFGDKNSKERWLQNSFKEQAFLIFLPLLEAV